MWHFICESDLHFGHKNHVDEIGDPRTRKPISIYQIRNYYDLYRLDFVLCIGDMTDHGSYRNDNGCCCRSKGNEFDAFLNNYLSPIEQYGIPVKLCIGNHDINRLFYPKNKIMKFISKRHK